jgi:hypothetical protein
MREDGGLYKPPGVVWWRHWAAFEVGTAALPTGGMAKAVVPAVRHPKQDSQIHALSARSLLGDLERGESWIHLNQNQSALDAVTKEQLVRLEGERLGCKWSLVSKWTSFVAIEERYDVASHQSDSFIDDVTAKRVYVDADMDLLHPRGVGRNATIVEKECESGG